jgi:hypothetical protein
VFQRIDFTQQANRFGEIGFSFPCQTHPTRRPVEQTYAQAVFEARQPTADGGSGHAQLQTGGGEVPTAGEADEKGEIAVDYYYSKRNNELIIMKL